MHAMFLKNAALHSNSWIYDYASVINQILVGIKITIFSTLLSYNAMLQPVNDFYLSRFDLFCFLSIVLF